MAEKRKGFTSGEVQIVTEKDTKACWSGNKNGASFQCALCAHKFTVGDKWRWIYANSSTPSAGNFMVCEACDAPNDVLIKLRQEAIAECTKWHEHHAEIGLAVSVVKLRSEIVELRKDRDELKKLVLYLKESAMVCPDCEGARTVQTAAAGAGYADDLAEHAPCTYCNGKGVIWGDAAMTEGKVSE